MTQSGHPLRLIGIRTIISKQSRAEDAPSELLQGRSVIGTRGLLDPITHQPQAKTHSAQVSSELSGCCAGLARCQVRLGRDLLVTPLA
jgi:hypothetical protein